MRAKILKSSQILRAHMPYFRRPGHKYFCTRGKSTLYRELLIFHHWRGEDSRDGTLSDPAGC